jgi:Spy/CpxP family protein refolding chaperone
MKKILSGAVGGCLILVIAAAQSFGGVDGFSDPRGRGADEARMPMMPLMMHQGAEMMMAGPGHIPMPLLRHLPDLGLDAKQKETVKAIEKKAFRNSIGKKVAIELAELDLMDALDKDTVDLGVVEDALKKLESLKTEMGLIHIKAVEETKAALTREQRNKLREMFAAGPHRETHMARVGDDKEGGPRERESGKSE